MENDPRQEKSTDDIIISGSTWAAIWHMAWPLVLNMVTVAIASFADVWVAGKLGSEAQAALGIGGQIWFLMMMLSSALSVGTMALVSRFWGAKDISGAVEACRQSLLFATIFGGITALIGLSSCRMIFHALGASPQVEQLGWDYAKIDLLSQLPFTVIWVVHAIFRAKGNARIPMIIWILMTTLIICFDLLFCLVLRLGISGLGLSWLIASTIGVILDLLLLKYSELGDCLNLTLAVRGGSLQDWFIRLFKIGIPSCIQETTWIGTNFVLLLIFAHTKDPTSSQASWAVGLRLEDMISFLPMHALGMVAGTIVGQNLGAKQPDRANRAGWQVALVGGILNLIVGATMYLAAKPIANLMSSDVHVVEYTVQYLQIIGLCQPFIALWFILFGAMQGAGYTSWPMWTTLLCLVGLRLPLCLILTIPFDLGPSGSWLGISISTCVIGCLAVWRFNTGVWQLQKV